MALDRVEPDRADVVDRGAEPDCLRDRRRSRLELVRQLVEGRLVESDRADHLAAEVERRHRLEQLARAPRARRRRSARRACGRRSRGNRSRAPGRRSARWGAAWAASTTMIAPCSCAQAAIRSTGLIVPSEFETRPVATTLIPPSRSEGVERVELELAAIVDRDVPEARAGAARDVLPRNEVRMMLQLGDDDDVAGAEVVEPPRVRDEVDRLGGAAGEDHLALGRRVEERGDRAARALVALGRPLRQPVHASVHVRVLVLVEMPHPVEHLARLLGRRRRIEIGDRLAVDQLLEYGEVRPQAVRVENRGGAHGHVPIVAGCRRQAAGRAARSGRR